jgi:hypothetical protein
MDYKTIEKIQEAIEADSDNQTDFQAYDDMDAVKFDFGDLLEDWMVPRVSTDGSEALKVLANIFDTHNPRINVLPFGEADKERAERAERWAEYHVMKINQRAGVSPFRKMAHMAGKYNRISAQVDYLPYWIPKEKKEWSKEQKEQMRGGPFCVKLHNPRNVYYSMGEYGLRWVASVTNMSAEEIIEQWAIYDKGETGKKIQSAIKKIEKMIEDDDECRFIQVDFTSHSKRQVSIFRTSNEDISDFENYEDGKEADKIDIMDAENKLGFLNWVVVEGDSTPLLAGIHKSGLYAYKTLLDTVVHSSVMRRAYPPVMISTTLDGKGVDVDYTGAEPEVRLKNGESVSPFQPPQLDNAVFTLAQQVAQQVEQSTGVKKLSGMDAGGNLQYSTVNAIIDLHMTNLEPYKRLSEKAATQIVLTMFKWIKFSEDTVEAFRTSAAKPEQVVGEQIFMAPDDFDEDRLLVEVLFTAKTDKMQAVNMASTLKQAGFKISDSTLLEKIGYQNPEVEAEKWEDEQLQSAAMQQFISKLQAQQQLETQAAQMQMQQQAQQAQMQQQQQPPQDPNAQGPMGQMANPDQSQPTDVSGQGFNPAMGGDPAMMAQPGMTATQIPGERQQ